MITILIIILIISEITGLIIYGLPVNHNIIYEFIKEQKQKSIRLNNLNSNIIFIGNMTYIAKPPLTIFFKYYIDGIGQVFRWSKTAKLIDQCYYEAINKKN